MKKIEPGDIIIFQVRKNNVAFVFHWGVVTKITQQVMHTLDIKVTKIGGDKIGKATMRQRPTTSPGRFLATKHPGLWVEKNVTNNQKIYEAFFGI
jgi:hypothetical protein